MHTLHNKLALITGAASGLGLASAKLFAKKGAALSLVDLSPAVNDIAKEIKKHNPEAQVTSHVKDLTKMSNVSQLLKEIKDGHSSYHCPNVLVNSAGIARVVNLTEMSEEEYDLLINTNLKGTFLITREIIKLLVENFPNQKFESETQSYASIINFGSVAGRYGAGRTAHYSITKAGVDAFAKSISREFGIYRIRSNTVCPYFIETPMVSQVMTPNKEKLYKLRTDLRRFGKPEEVAELVYFLATDASSFITGSTIDINGGF